MSAWTTILTGHKNLRIRCGYDHLETYNLGDTVEWSPNPFIAGEGKLLDGVYPAEEVCAPTGVPALMDEAYDTRSYGYVVIRNHVVERVILRENVPDGVTEEQLEVILGIVPFDPSWWSDAKWYEKRLLKALNESIAALESLRHVYRTRDMTYAEVQSAKFSMLGELVGAAIWEALGREGFAKKLLSNEPKPTLIEEYEAKLKKLVDEVLNPSSIQPFVKGSK